MTPPDAGNTAEKHEPPQKDSSLGWLGVVLSALTLWVLDRPRLAIVLALVVAALAATGLPRLSFDADSRSFFGTDNPQRKALEQLEATFGRYNNIIFIVTAKNGDLFTQENLVAIEDFTARAWRLPYTTRVDSLATFQRTFAEGDEILVEPLFEDASALTLEELAQVKSTALADEGVVGWMLSENAAVTMVHVAVQSPRKSRDEMRDMYSAARALQEDIGRLYPQFEVRASGGVMADAAFTEAGLRDLSTLVPLMLGLMVVALALGLRSWVATAITLLVVVLSVVTAMGLAGLFGIGINTATGGAPVIIMTLCIADCVHVIATMAQKMAEGQSKRAALRASLRFNAVAIFMTSFTDVLGFMALNFGDAPPLQDLGNVVSLGVVAGFFFSVILAPAILVLLPVPRVPQVLPGGRLMVRLSGVLVNRRRPIFALFAVSIVLLGTGVFKISYDDDFVGYFDESYAFRRDTEYLQDHLTGLQVLQFALPAGVEGGTNDPIYLKQVDAFARWLEEQPEVVSVSSLANIVKRLNRNLNGDDPAYAVVPDDKELIAQLLLFYELSVPFGHDMTSSVDIAKSISKVTAVLSRVSAAEIRQLAGEAENWMMTNTPSIFGPATGLSMAYATLSKTNVEAMMNGTLVALTLIAFTMFVALGNWRLALISLVPNLIPAFQALGFWGWVSGEINLAVSVVASISFGIIVDDTVHFLTKYAVSRRSGLAPGPALRRTLEEVGMAIMITSVVLIVGFAVLATSGFAVSMEMGVLTAVTILLALLAELMMMPALLLWFDRGRRW